MRRVRLVTLLSLFLCVVSLVGCQRREAGRFYASNGTFSVKALAGMREVTNLNQRAKLQIANPQKELYLMVLEENRQLSGKTGQVNLKKYTKLVKRHMLKFLQDSRLHSEMAVSIQGLTANRLVISGHIREVPITYVVGLVATPKHLYQVTAWTLSSHFAEYRPLLDQLVASFQVADINHASVPEPSSADPQVDKQLQQLQQRLQESVEQ